MSKLFVGQRVRIVWAPKYPEFVGVETRIIGIASGVFAYAGYEWIVTVNGEQYGANSRSLEPILPEGHRAGDYSLSQLLYRCKQDEGVPA